MLEREVVIYDPTLRDGQHAVKHQLSVQQIRDYARAADAARIPIIEVGHGNGLGASSLQVGIARLSDSEMISAGRAEVKNGQLAVFLCPGWGTYEDLKNAAGLGADIVRFGTHCTESNLCHGYLHMARKLNLEAHVVLLMSHMATPEQLAEAASQIQDNGATSIGIMDSAGTLLPDDVRERVSAIRNAVEIDVSFHGHNNLGMAVANSVAARASGASIIDACARGFGAGAGNTQLEAVVAVLTRMGYETGIDIKRLLVAVDIAQQSLMDHPPTIDSSSLASGIAGVFSGFKPRVRLEASEFNVSEWDIYTKLGELQVVAGQEDVIRGIAKELSNIR